MPLIFLQQRKYHTFNYIKCDNAQKLQFRHKMSVCVNVSQSSLQVKGHIYVLCVARTSPRAAN